MIEKTLYRNRNQKIIGGVCAGFAQYFNMDLSLMRLLWVILGLSGIGVIAYIAALIIVPYNPEEEFTDVEVDAPKITNKKALGVALIVFGLVLFLIQFEAFDYLFSFHISWKLVWGLMLILVGIVLLFRSISTEKNKDFLNIHDGQLYRPRENRMLFGVCAALSNYFHIDVSLLRVFWVLATLAAHGLGVIAYLILAIVFPAEESVNRHTQAN